MRDHLVERLLAALFGVTGVAWALTKYIDWDNARQDRLYRNRHRHRILDLRACPDGD